MPFKDKVVSLLRDAFSYAVHHESASDRGRKAQVAEQLIDFSKAAALGSGNYDDRLRATLLKTRTKFLDTLLEKKIAVSLDERFSQQQIDRKVREPGIAHPADIIAISGAFYPGNQNGAEGGLVALWDSGKGLDASMQHRNVTLLEGLARLLKEQPPRETVYAYTFLTAVGGEGGVAVLPTSEWDTQKKDSPARLTGSNALATPPAKPRAPQAA